MSYFVRKESECMHKKQTMDFETREVLCGFCGKVLNRKDRRGKK